MPEPLPILRIGHPVLLQRALPAGDAGDLGLQELLEAMLATMHDASGLGLAAPQVGRSVRAIVLLPLIARDQPTEEVAPLVLLDPELELDGLPPVLGVEGCLSIPELRGLVPRARTLRWRARDRAGRPIAGAAEGLTARILQHEVDHLDGILFPMRMTDLALLATADQAAHLLALLPPPERGPAPPGMPE